MFKMSAAGTYDKSRGEIENRQSEIPDDAMP